MSQPLPPGARNADPVTSQRAEGAHKGKRPTMRERLLGGYHLDHLGGGHGLTDEEAAVAADIDPLGGSCYWKRCSELRELGCIDVERDARGATVVRMGSLGHMREVCAITPYGIRAVFDPLLVRGSVDKQLTLIERQIRDCTTVNEVRELWRFYQRNGSLTEALQRRLTARAKQFAERKRTH